jgi:hypothetical protein
MRLSAIWRTTALATGLMICAGILPPQTLADEKDVSIARMPHVARAPATVQLQVRVTPRAENRVLRVSLDSGSYYRSSELALEGSQAAATHWVRWPGVPSGTYAVVVELFRSNGDRRVAIGQPLEVVGVLTED